MKRPQCPPTHDLLPLQTTTLNGLYLRGYVRVRRSSKSPPLRSRPGELIEIADQLYEVMYCYRIEEEPETWIYCCEERDNPMEQRHALQVLFEDNLGAGSHVKRVVKDVFLSQHDALQYFSDIYRRADATHFRNAQILTAKKVSSGIIVPTVT